MTTPSIVKKSLLRYLNSVIWLQEWNVEDPLKANPIINNKQYPPNAVIEIPTEGFDFSSRSNSLSDSGVVAPALCTIKTAYKIVWLFDRVRYPTFHSIPVRQIEDLLCKAGQFVIVNAQSIDDEIVDIEVLRLVSNNIGLKVRPANDVRSNTNGNQSWAIVASLYFSVSFISSLSDFAPDAFDQIQPLSWDLLEDGQPIPLTGDFELVGINIHLNRSKLPQVRQDEPSTYELEEILNIRLPEIE